MLNTRKLLIISVLQTYKNKAARSDPDGGWLVGCLMALVAQFSIRNNDGFAACVRLVVMCYAAFCAAKTRLPDYLRIIQRTSTLFTRI